MDVAVLDIRPGAGVMAVRLPALNGGMAGRLPQGVVEGIPLFSSCHRVSPFVSGSRGKNKLMGVISHEVSVYVDGYNRNRGTSARKPVVNRKYMADFYARLGIDETQLMEQLGVADSGTAIGLGRTLKGCAMLFVLTTEEQNNARLRHAWGGLSEGGFPLGDADYRRLVEDIAVLTALGKVNRMVMYYQLCLAARWPKKLCPKNYPTTLYSGLCPEKMELFDHHVMVPDGAVFAVQDPETRDFLLMAAPRGSGNLPSPAVWTPDYPPLEYNRVPLEYEAVVRDGVWDVEKLKQIVVSYE